MRYLLSVLILSIGYLYPSELSAQNIPFTAPGNRNPIIPGYFADPTVKCFNGTYYIYATTDGNGGGLGPSQVWTSTDFVNWTMQDMNWPTTHNYWAPDVALGNDGKYYLYYCQPTVEIYGASSSTPVGPWTPLFPDGKAVVPNYLVPKVITLDGQTFRDDDGKYYMTWGTWGIYPGYGCGVGLLNPDMKSFAKTAQIPNTLAKDFFEGSFLFKRKGIYYLLYSSGFCEDETYRVQYAMSKTGPMDGFQFGKDNPILATSADGTIHGPGHNSVLQIGNDYYIIYHRHNNPHSGGGYNRQVCADKLVFDADGNIEKVIPTHSGIGYLGKNTIPYPNLAYQKKVTASSYYDAYNPEFAVDDNNGTLWKPKDNSAVPAWIEVDLGKLTTVKSILTQFEYATWYYQYHIEYSADGKQWQMFADKSANRWHGSPAVDVGNVKARFIKLTITGTEQPGLYKAIWNIKVFSEGNVAVMPSNIHHAPKAEQYVQKGLLIDLNTEALQPGEIINSWKNKGVLGGEFKADGKAPFTDFVAGKKAVVFTGQQSLRSAFNVPLSLAGNNSYTICFWAYAAEAKDDNPILSWANSNEQLSAATFGYGRNRDFGAAHHNGFADLQYSRNLPLAGKWHQVAITFDGTFEKVFVDGQINNQENKMLFVKLAEQFSLGKTQGSPAAFSGAIASLQVYDVPLSDTAIQRLYNHVKQEPVSVYLDAKKLPYGKLENWKNEGSAGGVFKAVNGNPVVADASGRISVCLSGKESLVLDKALALTGDHSLVISQFTAKVPKNEAMVTLTSSNAHNSFGLNNTPTALTGQWHYIIKTFKGDTVKLYIDGQLQSTTYTRQTASGSDSLYIGSSRKSIPGFSGSVTSFSVYQYALQESEIKTFTSNWQTKLHSPVDTALYYKQQPKAISPSLASMEAGNQTQQSNLQYMYTRLINGVPVSQSDWQDSPYYLDEGLLADHRYEYTFKIKDNWGNVTGGSPIGTITTSTAQFNTYADEFNTKQDFLLAGTSGSIWDERIGKGDKQSATVIVAANGSLKLESQGTSWDGNAPYGPFIYKNVKGNFIAEVEVSDVSGLAENKVAGNNDAGLMVRADNQLGTNKEQLLQNGIFPAWNVGNLLTNFEDGNRRQTNNQSAWKYNRYLQIQRQGNWFYIRTSKDNSHWVDLPGSPVFRPDLENKTLQVGLYQCTYGPGQAYGSFKNFRLIQVKQK
ncbi:family 43 glycosylhydrolase [Mucilaginibacter paludis]|nr:family 43 glycosylhydrolase [Mucilaginibacter paludis]